MKSASWHKEPLPQQRPQFRAQMGKTELKQRPVARRRRFLCSHSHSHSSALFLLLFQHSFTQWYLVKTNAAEVYSKQQECSMCATQALSQTMDQIFGGTLRNPNLEEQLSAASDRELQELLQESAASECYIELALNSIQPTQRCCFIRALCLSKLLLMQSLYLLLSTGSGTHVSLFSRLKK